MPRRHREPGHDLLGDASSPSLFQTWLPPLNFITIHYAYFIVVCLITSVVFWGSSDPAGSISYTDSLFVVVSAMTETGLNTVNLSQMTTWQQTMLLLLIVFGSSIWVSIWTVVARKHVFEKRFQDVVRAERMRRASRSGSGGSLPRFQRFLMFGRSSTIALPRSPVIAPREAERSEQNGSAPATQETTDRPGHSGALDDGSNAIPAVPADPLERPISHAHIIFVDNPHPNEAVSTASQCRPDGSRATRRNRSQNDDTARHGKSEFSIGQLLTRTSSGRNAQFYGLTSEERERLGGCEYRALRLLSVIVPLYFVLWQFLGCLALGVWVNNRQPGPPLGNGINPWWLGIFNGASAFNNSGMSLLDANMIPFQDSAFVLLTMGLLILVGNTAYPVFLRLIIWSLLRLLMLATKDDDFAGLKGTLKFILRYPRRVYTNLFPARPTWWLVFMLILLNSVDWVAFELLNLGNRAMASIPPSSRVLDGLFQALGGFYVVPIPSVYIGLQLLYVVMMYISVYPVVITMRHSNVYEERSLGIYSEDEISVTDPETATPLSAHGRCQGNSGIVATLGHAISQIFTWHGVGVRAPKQGLDSHISFISQQIHGQLAHDIWWLVLSTLIIVTINTSNFLADPINFSVFNVIFEVVSAYGCVGISVGVPNDSFSFSGSWHTASKLVLCAVMLRGRHRGLPVALDRAVRLPGEELHREEEEDHRIRRSLSNRRASVDTY